MTTIIEITYTNKLYLIQTGKCFYCCVKLAPGSFNQKTRKNGYTKDHVIPRHWAPSGPDNLVLCCRKCNADKGGRLPSNRALLKYELLYTLLKTWPSLPSKDVTKLSNWRLPNY